MVPAVVLAYFLIVVTGVAVLVFPACRDRLFAALAAFLNAGKWPFLRAGSWFFASSRRLNLSLKQSAGEGKLFISSNPALVFGAFLVLVTPASLALLIKKPAVFDFADELSVADRQIAILLEGEQLAPPSPLPPEAFTTREVEMVRPDAAQASRNWQLLDPEFMQRLLVVFRLMKERHGYEMVLIEGYRSPERQASLFELGAHVTQAAANMSYHQHGLAADSAFFRDGKVVISERDPWAMRGYQLYGEIAAQVGLTWGGNWKMQDYGHVELRRAGVLGRGIQSTGSRG